MYNLQMNQYAASWNLWRTLKKNLAIQVPWVSLTVWHISNPVECDSLM